MADIEFEFEYGGINELRRTGGRRPLQERLRAGAAVAAARRGDVDEPAPRPPVDLWSRQPENAFEEIPHEDIQPARRRIIAPRQDEDRRGRSLATMPLQLLNPLWACPPKEVPHEARWLHEADAQREIRHLTMSRLTASLPSKDKSSPLKQQYVATDVTTDGISAVRRQLVPLETLKETSRIKLGLLDPKYQVLSYTSLLGDAVQVEVPVNRAGASGFDTSDQIRADLLLDSAARCRKLLNNMDRAATDDPDEDLALLSEELVEAESKAAVFGGSAAAKDARANGASDEDVFKAAADAAATASRAPEDVVKGMYAAGCVLYPDLEHVPKPVRHAIVREALLRSVPPELAGEVCGQFTLEYRGEREAAMASACLIAAVVASARGASLQDALDTGLRSAKFEVSPSKAGAIGAICMEDDGQVRKEKGAALGAVRAVIMQDLHSMEFKSRQESVWTLESFVGKALAEGGAAAVEVTSQIEDVAIAVADAAFCLPDAQRNNPENIGVFAAKIARHVMNSSDPLADVAVCYAAGKAASLSSSYLTEAVIQAMAKASAKLTLDPVKVGEVSVEIAASSSGNDDFSADGVPASIAFSRFAARTTFATAIAQGKAVEDALQRAVVAAQTTLLAVQPLDSASDENSEGGLSSSQTNSASDANMDASFVLGSIMCTLGLDGKKGWELGALAARAVEAAGGERKDANVAYHVAVKSAQVSHEKEKESATEQVQGLKGDGVTSDVEDEAVEIVAIPVPPPAVMTSVRINNVDSEWLSKKKTAGRFIDAVQQAVAEDSGLDAEYVEVVLEDGSDSAKTSETPFVSVETTETYERISVSSSITSLGETAAPDETKRVSDASLAEKENTSAVSVLITITPPNDVELDEVFEALSSPTSLAEEVAVRVSTVPGIKADPAKPIHVDNVLTPVAINLPEEPLRSEWGEVVDSPAWGASARRAACRLVVSPAGVAAPISMDKDVVATQETYHNACVDVLSAHGWTWQNTGSDVRNDAVADFKSDGNQLLLFA